MKHKAVYLLFCKFTLHVSAVNHTHHQEYKNCNYNLWYWSYFFAELPPTNVANWPRWLEVAVQRSMTSTGGCSNSFMYS